MIDDVKTAIQMIGESPYGELTKGISQEVTVKHKVFNDELVSDHYAIIPNPKKKPNFDELSKDQRTLYERIVKRFIACFYPPAIYEATEITIECEGEQFHAKGKRLISPGYLVVINNEDENNDDTPIIDLPQVEEGVTLKCADTKLHIGKTAPPPVYREDICYLQSFL